MHPTNFEQNGLTTRRLVGEVSRQEVPVAVILQGGITQRQASQGWEKLRVGERIRAKERVEDRRIF